MNQRLKKTIKKTPLYNVFDNIRWRISCSHNIRSRNKIIEEWEKKGSLLPPPSAYKHKTLLEYKNRFQLTSLVETGTFRGEMIYAMKDHFDLIQSIELYDVLFKRACRLFSNNPNIKLYLGDSSEKLAEILDELTVPCLFWLDAHYSGDGTAKGDIETPILREMELILSHTLKTHVILIDDAREFIKGLQDYPTLDQIEDLIKQYIQDYSFEVKNDIIRIFFD